MPADYARLCSILNLTQAFKERKKEEKSPNTFNSLTLRCHKCFGQRWPTSSYVWKESKVGKWLQKIGIFCWLLVQLDLLFVFFLYFVSRFLSKFCNSTQTVAIGYQWDSLSVLVYWSDFDVKRISVKDTTFGWCYFAIQRLTEEVQMKCLGWLTAGLKSDALVSFLYCFGAIDLVCNI